MSYKDIVNKIQKQLSKSNDYESPSEELTEYKKDFLEMNIGSLNAIMNHAKSILDSLSDETVKNNLTESWLQGKIAVTEDYMRTIHDFVKYVPDNDDKVSAGCGCGKKKQAETQKAEPKPQTQNQPKGKSSSIHKAK